MQTFRAFRIHQDGGQVRAGIEELPLEQAGPGEVLIRAAYSSVNYKDALAGSGRGKIMHRFPLTGGIDVSGVVAESADRRFHEGDQVLVTGYGLSQDHDGGYAEYARVPGDWVVPLPDRMSLYDAMALGTAGFTAGLAVQRMEDNRQRPERGPIAVTGATGGVGSFAIDLLSGLGYEVVAITGKVFERDYLVSLGAAEVRSRHDLAIGTRPLEKAIWGGAVDSAGGELLAWLTRTVGPWGNIASIGLAAGHDLHTTVMPFILRGVSLLGIDSARCEMPLRQQIWDRLSSDLAPRHLSRIARRTIGLEELPDTFGRMLLGELRGRTVVLLGPSPDQAPA